MNKSGEQTNGRAGLVGGGCHTGGGWSLSVFICLLLSAVTFAVYWPVTRFDFINCDDPENISANPIVQSGLTWKNVVWAFTTDYNCSWYPLTWLSFMLDVELFGKGAGGPHFMNLLLHVANALSLFLILRQFTGAQWRSALVAGLFALHPLRVETVAWVAERRDLLSSLFWLLTLWAYGNYAESKIRNPPAKRDETRNYCLALVFFALGLMAKSMLVTLPFALLLLDYWPLGRISFGPRPWTPNFRVMTRLVLEKIPFFALTAISCVITLVVYKSAGVLAGGAAIPWVSRIERAFVSYAQYLGKTFWPVNLAVFHPYQGHWPVAQVVSAMGLVFGLSLAVVWLGRRKPYGFVGWFWFLGTLIPVIGLLQWLSLGICEHYTYMPLVGIFIILAWGTGDVLARGRLSGRGMTVVGFAAALLLAACALRTRDQLWHWQNSETLFRRTLAVTKNNYFAYDHLGHYLREQGRYREATECYQRVIQILPNNSIAHNNLGTTLRGEGKLDEAVAQFREAVRLSPDYLKARRNLAATLDALGENDEAIAHYGEVLRLSPGDAEAEYRLSVLLDRVGRSEEAMAHGRRAVLGRPDYAEARQQLGELLVRVGDKTNAVAQWREAMRLKPGWPAPLNSLAWMLATDKDAAWRDGAEAVRLGEWAAQVTTNRVPEVLDTLAAAYAESGRYEKAIKTAQRAIELAEASGKEKLAVEIRVRLEVYRAERQWRE